MKKIITVTVLALTTFSCVKEWECKIEYSYDDVEYTKYKTYKMSRQDIKQLEKNGNMGGSKTTCYKK